MNYLYKYRQKQDYKQQIKSETFFFERAKVTWKIDKLINLNWFLEKNLYNSPAKKNIFECLHVKG